MGPSKPTSKGKSVDQSHDNATDWIWDGSRGYYWRSDRYGRVETWDPPTNTSQQQLETPRSSRENALSNNTSHSTTAPTWNNRSTRNEVYSTAQGAANDYSASATTQIYQTPTTNAGNYTVASPAPQAVIARGQTVNFSPQLATAGSTNSAVAYSNLQPYGSSSASQYQQYASTRSNYVNDGYDNSGYDKSGGLSTALGGLSLSRNPTVPEQNYLESSGTIRGPVDNAEREQLDPRYRVISDKDQRKFWRVGRVFMMLWTEPAKTMGGSRNGTHYSTTWLEQGAYSEIRRFVVMREGYGNSICSPIHTYNGQATLKANLPERHQHTIIYTSNECPPEHSYVADDDTIVKENLTKDPIKVRREQDDIEGDLGDYSRLNYSKIYTVENYVRVLKIGMVEKDWLPTLNANSYVRPMDHPVQKPTTHKPEKGSKQSSSSSGHRKEKESRRQRR